MSLNNDHLHIDGPSSCILFCKQGDQIIMEFSSLGGGIHHCIQGMEVSEKLELSTKEGAPKASDDAKDGVWRKEEHAVGSVCWFKLLI